MALLIIYVIFMAYLKKTTWYDEVFDYRIAHI
jgi:hypothetical protein